MHQMFIMMASSNGNIFRVTDPFQGEFNGHRWIPLTKASDAELWCFLWFTHERTIGGANNRDAGDLRRHRLQNDVTVMFTRISLHKVMKSHEILLGGSSVRRNTRRVVSTHRGAGFVISIYRVSWVDRKFSPLTHCGILAPYGVIEIGQHWFR